MELEVQRRQGSKRFGAQIVAGIVAAKGEKAGVEIVVQMDATHKTEAAAKVGTEGMARKQYEKKRE